MKKKTTQLLKQKTNKNFFKFINFSFIHNSFKKVLLFVLIILLPTQFGKHFFLSFSYIFGVRVDYLAPTIYITDIMVGCLFLINIKEVIKPLIHKYAFFFILFFILNITFSLSPLISLYRILKLFEFWVIFITIYRSSMPVHMFLSGFLIGSAYELFLSIIQMAQNHSIQGIWYFFGERAMSLSTPNIAKASILNREFLRPYGTFSHPNSLAGFYLLIYTALLFLKNKIKYHSLLFNLLLLSSSYLILISFSKSALFGFILVTAYSIIVTKNYCRICVIARIFIGSIIVFLFMFAHTDPLSFKKRVELILNSLQIISQYPFFGTGLGAYLYAQKIIPSHFPLFINQPVHNIFLLVTSEVGIPITVYILFIIIKFFKQNFFNYFPFILIILITGLFDHYWITLQQNFLLLSVLGGLILRKTKN